MWLVALNDEVYRAIGRPDVNTKLRFASIIFFLPAYLISAPFGLMVFTITRVGVSLLSIPIRAYLCVRILGVSPLYLWDNGKTIILSTIVMAATVIIAQHLFTAFKVDLSAVLPLVVQITIGLVTYTSILWLFDRPYVLSLKELIKRAASA